MSFCETNYFSVGFVSRKRPFSTEQSDSHIESKKSSIRLDVRVGLLCRKRF